MKTIQDCFTFRLNDGVRTVKVELGDDYAWGVGPDGRSSWLHGQYKIGKDLFMSATEAAKAAEAARRKKVESLRKQLAKLEKMTFEPS